MGIEAMALGAGMYWGDGGGQVRVDVRDVRVGAPYLLSDGRPGGVDVTMADEGSGTLTCRVTSVDEVGATTEHVTAVVAAGAAAAQPATAAPPPQQDADPSVSAELLYRLFFHGPSMRVLQSAYYPASTHPAEGRMVGVLATDLPPIAVPPGPSATAPLLVEACLQTAGAWELGASGRMMVPHSIEMIERFSHVESGSDRPLRAVVRPRPGTPNSVFDAEVVDAAGGLQLRVAGYRTVPFPLPIDPAPMAPVLAALAGIPPAG